MSIVEFVGPTDPRWLDTLEHVQKELTYVVLVGRYEAEEFASDGPLDEGGTFDDTKSSREPRTSHIPASG